MTESDIQKALKAKFDHIYVLLNSYIFAWESDYFGVTRQTGYAYEVEIKISKSDFKADFKKEEKHHCLQRADKEMIVFKSKEKEEKVQVGTEIRRGIEWPVYDWKGAGYCPLVFKNNFIPNRFYYAVPSTIVESIKDIIPKYAGLLSVHENRSVNEIKTAPLLHNRKMIKKLSPILLDKFYYTSMKQSIEISELKSNLKLKDIYYEDNFEEKISQMQLEL